MSHLHIQITARAKYDQKAALVRDVTDSLVRALDEAPEQIHVVIREIGEEDWGVAGQLLVERYRASAPP